MLEALGLRNEYRLVTERRVDFPREYVVVMMVLPGPAAAAVAAALSNKSGVTHRGSSNFYWAQEREGDLQSRLTRHTLHP